MASTSSPPMNISFGIELEFMCAYDPDCFVQAFAHRLQRGDPIDGEPEERDWEDYSDEDASSDVESYDGSDLQDEDGSDGEARRRLSPIPPEIHEAMYYSLLDVGVPAFCPMIDDNDESSKFEGPYERWIVDDDMSNDLTDAEEVVYPEGEKYGYASVELASRKFDLMRDDWRGEIEKVMNALARLQRMGARIFNNTSTGFHVHVGAGDQRKIPLRVAKNVLQLATAFERVLDGVHATNRTKDDVHNDNFSHTPVSWFHRHNGKSAMNGLTMIDWLATVEQAQTYKELGEIFTLPRAIRARHFGPLQPDESPRYGHHSAMNFDNLYVSDKEVEAGHTDEELTGTIEFRQHAGSIDLVQIVAWVCLTTSMVRFCADAPAADFLALCARGVDVEFTLRDFLAAIRCPPDVTAVLTRDDEHEDAIIGFLGSGNENANQDVLALAEEFDDLIAVNDDEESELRDESKVASLASDKEYGLVPSAHAVQIPAHDVEQYYKEALAEIVLASHSSDSEECAESWARTKVLQRLAAEYKEAAASQ